MQLKAYANNITVQAGLVENDTSKNYKWWDNLENLKNQDGIAYCRHPNYTSPLIAGTNGTFNRPAPIVLSNFDFSSIPDDAIISNVILHYKQQTFINNGYYAEIGGLTAYLLGTDFSKTSSFAVSETLTERTLTFTGVTVNQLKNSVFGVKIAYPQNTSTTPGRIILQDVYLEINYEGITSVNYTMYPNATPIRVSQSFNLYVVATKVGTGAFNMKTLIEIPENFIIQSTPSGTSINGNKITWNANYTNSQTSKTLTIPLQAVKAGISEVTVQETNTEQEAKLRLDVNNISVTNTTNFYPNQTPIPQNKEVEFYITFKSDDLQPNTNEPKRATIIFDGNVTFKDINTLMGNLSWIKSYHFEYRQSDNITFFWIIWEDNKTQRVIPFRAVHYNNGIGRLRVYNYLYDQTHIANDFSKKYIVIPEDLTTLCYSYIQLPPDVIDNMQNGEIYTIASLGKYENTKPEFPVIDYGTNLRLGVYNNPKEFLEEDNQDFTGLTIWSDILTSNETEHLINFVYDENFPLYLVYSQQYYEDPQSNTVTAYYSEPVITPYTAFETLETFENRPIPTPLTNVVSISGYSRGSLPPETQTSLINCYNWDNPYLDYEDNSIQGIKINFNYETSSDLLLEFVIVNNGNKSGVRTTYLNKGSGVATVGGTWDLFDISSSEIKDISQLQIEFYARNLSNSTTVDFKINNLSIDVSYINRIVTGYGFNVDGVRGEDLGIYLEDLIFNFGTDNDTSEYHVAGTDNTEVNRLNINSKEIQMKIKISECNIKELIPQIDRIVELFTNKRQLYSNKPILKRIIFDLLPDRYYDFVRIKEFDDEFKGGMYKATITLYIPDGTAFEITPTITGSVGYANTTINIEPVITVRAETKGRIEVIENINTQIVLLESNLIHVGDEIIIDCKNRRIYINNNEKTDLIHALNMQSTWFKIKENYNFSSSNCEIISVEYNNRKG